MIISSSHNNACNKKGTYLTSATSCTKGTSRATKHDNFSSNNDPTLQIISSIQAMPPLQDMSMQVAHSLQGISPLQDKPTMQVTHSLQDMSSPQTMQSLQAMSAIQDIPAMQDKPILQVEPIVQAKQPLQDMPTLQVMLSLHDKLSQLAKPSIQVMAPLQDMSSIRGVHSLQDMPSPQSMQSLQDKSSLHDMTSIQVVHSLQDMQSLHSIPSQRVIPPLQVAPAQARMKNSSLIVEFPKRRTMTEAGFGAPSAKRIRHERQTRVKTLSHANIQGARNKKQQLSRFIEEIAPDIMGLCETHCVDQEDLPRIAGYEWVTSPGSGRSAGVGILINKEIEMEIGEVRTVVIGRVIGVELERFTLIEAYSPVEGSEMMEIEDFYNGLYEAIAWSRGLDKHEIMLGDFNAHIRGWWNSETNQNGIRLREMCKQWGQELLQLDKPTHLHSTGGAFCLDYAIMNWGLKDKIIDYDVNEDCPIKSDHLPITVKIWNWGLKPYEQKRKRIRLDRLQNPVFLKLYQSEIDRCLMEELDGDIEVTDQIYETVCMRLIKIAESVLGVAEDRKQGILSRGALQKLGEARRCPWKALKGLRKGKGDLHYKIQMAKYRQQMKEFKKELKRVKFMSLKERKIEKQYPAQKTCGKWQEE
ncbi:unnamed protein product [Blepharisma stoltei]|uniref:Endonuclease/exonuclease/phosphatase domain-containing protein n=1 Tax=Blepharisma stoltei TaxID=1481888 RepID=A0AAU9JQH2_9CILI|nr:unnamed protein product [Blepharisma stoltei]